MSTRTTDFATIRAWDHEHFVHPWQAIADSGQNMRSFYESGEGVYVRDEMGRRYLDGPAGMWCMQLGYGNTEIAEAMAEQARDLAYFSPFNHSHSRSAELAHKIAEKAPAGLNKVFFTTGGSTAVDTALRFVQFRNNLLGLPQKKLIISREKAYHGSTFLSASVSGKERDKGWLDQARGLCHFLPNVNPFTRRKEQTVAQFLSEKLNDLERAIVRLGADRVAAFIAEPILASGGVIVPPQGYHKGCLEICRKYDVLYISDEVVTGFGRLGHWFASEEVFGIVPDMITCAKGLTSGYAPMGACVIADRLFDDLREPGKEATFSNGFTYSGHPVSVAAALKSMEIIEREDILTHVREVSPVFQECLRDLASLPLVVETRGMGLVGGVDCSVQSDGHATLADDRQLGHEIDQACQERGLIMRPLLNMCVCSPPLTITEQQIRSLFAILKEAIVQVQENRG